MNDGNNDEKWQWVDEDPFEKLLVGSKSAGTVDSPLPQPQSAPDLAATVEITVETKPKESDPAIAAEAFELAVSLEKEEKWDEAASAFRKTLEIEPGRVDALIGLGACLLHLEDAAEALNCFEECLLSTEDRERAMFGRAVTLQKLMRNEEADLAYRELLEIAPNAAEALGNLIALSVARQDAAAVGEYSRWLLKLDPHSKAALQGLATQALWKGDFAAAVGYCKRVVELAPDSYEGWVNLGFAMQHRRPKEKAVRSIA